MTTSKSDSDKRCDSWFHHILWLANNAFVLQLLFTTKVDQQSESKTGRFQVIVYLCPVFLVQVRDRLEFDNDLIITDKVRLERLYQTSALILSYQLRLRRGW